MKIQGKLIIIGGAVDKGSFTETNLDKDAPKNLNFFEEGILKFVYVWGKAKKK
jgi:cyanophycinase